MLRDPVGGEEQADLHVERGRVLLRHAPLGQQMAALGMAVAHDQVQLEALIRVGNRSPTVYRSLF